MASTKNNFLNAKPVSKLGGKSGGVRKPNKPYNKPPAKPKAEKPARWDAKTKTERLQEAAKTKPKSPAPRPVVTKPVTRTGPVKGPVPPKGSSSVTMPNSRRAGVNLPKEGARAERTAQRVVDLKKAAAAKASQAPKASTVTPEPSAASRLGQSMSGAAKAARGAGRFLGVAGTAFAAADTASRVFNPKNNIVTELGRLGSAAEKLGSGGGANVSPAQRAAQLAAKRNAKPTKPPLSSQGVRSSNGNTVRTGSPEYNSFRQQQLDGNKRRNAAIRDTTPTRSSSSAGSSGPSRFTGSGSSTQRSSAPRSTNTTRSQTPPAPRFTGTVDEGRQKWAEKYSSAKYEGQAIQKEAKKLLDEMKKRKEDKSNATKAGWDGNKNY